MSHSFPHLTSGSVGPVGFDDMNALFELANRVQAILPRLERLARRSQAAPPRLWFFGEITGNALIPGEVYRWLYSWRSVGWNPNDWEWQPMMSGGVISATGRAEGSPLVEINSTIDGDQFALGAVNGCEHRNAFGDGTPGNAIGMIGPGVDSDDPAYADCELEPKPISSGVVVPVFTLHGKLSRLQVTGGRSPVNYMFSLGNAHGRITP